MKLTDKELNELKYHYVDRIVDNMSTKDLVQYVFDDMLRYVDTIPEVEFLEDCQDYWEEHFDEVVKDIKEYANSKFKKPIEDRLDTDKTGQEFREELDEINTDWQPDDVFDEIVADAEEALANESEIKSLNFR